MWGSEGWETDTVPFTLARHTIYYIHVFVDMYFHSISISVRTNK